MAYGKPPPYWQRYDIRQIEDLGNAVLGARLNVVQMASAPIRGSLVFAADQGIIFSSGLIEGQVTLCGPLSDDAITLGVGLRFGPGSRHWLNEVADGDVGVILPRDLHDAYYTQGTLYLAATLTEERLEQIAEREGLPFNREMMSHTRLHSEPVSAGLINDMRRRMILLHCTGCDENDRHTEIGGQMLRMIVEHFGRVPTSGDGRVRPQGKARIVAKARDFIHANLATPISLDSLADVAETSRRTLNRAFAEVLEVTPMDYVRRLRLHRLRQELTSPDAAECTVTLAARQWGLGGDMGRLAGRYRELFGELPSVTCSKYSEENCNTWL